MKKIEAKLEIQDPKNQLKLYGYENYFNSFVDLIKKNKIPNTILVTGPKGSGKSTFIYHIVNYFLSLKEEKKYTCTDSIINKDNTSYKLVNQNIHPNFFHVKNEDFEKEIKIEKVRDLISFLSKTTYKDGIKIVMIDNAEYLNLNSSNALLKALEEPRINTFFFIIHDSSFKILETIKSRCVEFKILFNKDEKIKIFNSLVNFYNLNSLSNLNEYLSFDTPGNLVKYLLLSKNTEIPNFLDDKLNIALYFLDGLRKNKTKENLTNLIFFIQVFYNNLLLSKNNNINSFFYNYSKILILLNNMFKYNLDEKSVLISVENVLKEDAK